MISLFMIDHHDLRELKLKVSKRVRDFSNYKHENLTQSRFYNILGLP